MSSNPITNTEDTLYSLDILERIDWLEEAASQGSLVEDEKRELETLKKVADQAGPHAPDWEYGEVLIRDSHFKKYAMELAEEVGSLDSKVKWPYTCIDWDLAAKELQRDYTSVEFGDVTYWIR